MKLKKLPIGIQTFSTIREEDYLYIDKTQYALNLIENYTYVFLARPRRFGKSLFLDTLSEIFSGNKELFKGLYIYDKYNFEKYPVIRISWAGNEYSSITDIHDKTKRILKQVQEDLNLTCEKDLSYMGCFEYLIKQSYKKYNKKVVILIDEYDKPILIILMIFQQLIL